MIRMAVAGLGMATQLGILGLPPGLTTRGPHPWPTFRGTPENVGTSETRLRPLMQRRDARPLARFATGGLIWGSPVIARDGTVYVGSADKSVYALTPGPTGYTPRWSYPIFDRPDALIDSACALTSDGHLVVPGGDGYLHGLDAATGFPRWTFRASAAEDRQRTGVVVGSFEGNVQVGPDRALYAGSDDGAMYALNPDGTRRWRLQTGMMVWSSPAIDPINGDWLAFGSLDGHVYLVEARTGKVLDRYAAGGDVKSSPCLDAQGRLVVGTSAGQVLALQVKQTMAGWRLWKSWSFDAGAEVYASPARWGTGVIVGAMDGRIHALDGAGKSRWTYRARGRVAASAVVSQDGVAVVGSSDGTLYALDADEGSRLWSLRVTPSRLRANLDSSPAIATDGTIHVGSYDGGLYSIPAAWPLAHRDDPRVAVGGRVDLPDWGGPAATATLRYQDPLGAYHTAPAGAIGLGETLRLRLLAPGDDDARRRFALNLRDLSVTSEPAVPLEARLSSDGRFLNVTPRGLWPAGQRFALAVHATYRAKRDNWLLDRYDPLAAWYPVDARLTFQATPAGRAVPAGPLAWAASRLYLHQPAALDTYTPAALDGQATILVAPAGAGPDGRVAILGLPALPHLGGPRVLGEPSKAFTLEGRVADGWLRAHGAFALAAMGGTIPFESFEAAAPLRADGGLGDGEFVARAPLWGIRGSGAAYSFPAALLNEVADHGLRLNAVGAFEGGRPAPVTDLPAFSDLRREAAGLRVRFTGPRAGEHLLAALAVGADGRPAGYGAVRVPAGHTGDLALPWLGRAPDAEARVYLVFDGVTVAAHE